MSHTFSVSAFHYTKWNSEATIEDVAAELKEQGFGIEWWPRGFGIPPLTDEHVGRWTYDGQSPEFQGHE